MPSALPLVHSFIFVFPFAPNHPFFLPAAYTSMHPYLLYALHLCASTSLSLIFSRPAILHPPTHPYPPFYHSSIHTPPIHPPICSYLYIHPFIHLLYIHMLPTSLPIHQHTTYPIHTPFTYPHIHQYISLSTNQMLPTHPPIHQIVYPLPIYILVYLPIHPPVYPSRHHPSHTSPSIHLHTPTPQPAHPSGSSHNCNWGRHFVQYWHCDNGESA